MAQQFQVLRCCFCNIFQVQQVKKNRKWNCKVCNEKQSILKVFGQGSGSDCRRHVQKLNLLQGEIQQGPVNVLRDTEEAIEMNDEDTVNFKEELGQQEEKKEIFSRWNKYLDKKCEEQEEEVLQTEEDAYFSKGNLMKQTRKHKKTDLYSTDAQECEKRNVSGFVEDVKRHEESSHDSATVSTECCEDATSKNVLTPNVESHMVHRKNKAPCTRDPGFSKWDRFLLPGKSYTSDATTATLQKGQETLVETSAVAGKNKRTASSISISSHNWHLASQQNVAISREGAEEVNTTHPITLVSIPVGKNKQPPSLPSVQFQERLLNGLPEETTSIHSISVVAVSSSETPFRSLFSTEDDFDDYI